MRLVIAYTPGMLRPAVKQLGEDVGAEFIDVSGSDLAYGELVADLWQQGDSFLLLEHDVLPTAALLEEMWNCGSEWCAGFAWGYAEFRHLRPARFRVTALMLNKFGADLLRQTPAVPSAVRVRWTQVDLALLGVLAQHAPCLHGPMTHLRAQHPAWAMEMTEDEWADV
jgi:hypothetical protein